MTGATLTDVEARVIGSLIEKALTTPDGYPLSLNATTVACNQVSNREPIVEYDDGLVEVTLRSLADRGLAKLVHRPGDRVVKYKHAVDRVIGLGPEALAMLAVLLLRGAQTPGELRQRTSRYVSFPSLVAVEAALDDLASRGHVTRLARVPGQKESRYVELLTTGSLEYATLEQPTEARELAEPSLRAEVVELQAQIDALRSRLDRVYGELGLE